MASRSEVREFAGETRDEAISKAASYFGLPEAELDYKAVEEETPIAGLGTRVLVIAAPKGHLQMRSGGDGRRGDRDRNGRGRDRDRGERGRDGDRGRGGERTRGRGGRGRDRGSERGDRGGRGPRERGDRGRGGGDRDRDQDRPLTEEERELEKMAQEAARHVREDGEPQLLPAMSSKERWVVHNALKDESGIRSESEGDGPIRRVKILPA